MKVDFFFVGPSKTASTWLFTVLQRHPRVVLPEGKDLYFFDRFYDKGVDWYHSQFETAEQNAVFGDFSHDYILSDTALQRIKEYNPDAGIMIVMRDPYSRTESGINFLNRNGYGYSRGIDAVEAHSELINGSLYGENLERVFRVFDEQQVLLLSYEDLQNDPEAFVEPVFPFLNIEKVEGLAIQERINERAVPRSTAAAGLVKFLALKARAFGLHRLVGKIKLNPLVLKVLYKESAEGFRLGDSDKQYLSAYFEKDIDKLEAITGKNFAHWRLPSREGRHE